VRLCRLRGIRWALAAHQPMYGNGGAVRAGRRARRRLRSANVTVAEP
jgi:hypothetical protein